MSYSIKTPLPLQKIHSLTFHSVAVKQVGMIGLVKLTKWFTLNQLKVYTFIIGIAAFL